MEREAWKNLVSQSWGKHAELIAVGEAVPLIDEAELFRVFVSAAKHFLEQGDFEDFKLYVDSRQEIDEVVKYLPAQSEENFEEFAERLTAASGVGEFLFFANSIEQFSEVLRRRVEFFLSGLFEITGWPAGQVDCELFVGRYQRTPGGIHRASCANFHFPVVGEKTFYVWPPDTFDASDRMTSQRGTGREEYLHFTGLDWKVDRRREIVARPGEVIFCPPEHWHVGHAKELQACINISIYTDGWEATAAEEAFRDLMKGYNHDEIRDDGLPGTLKELCEEGNFGMRVWNACLGSWMRKVTRYSLGTTRSRQPRIPIGEHSRISPRKHALVKWHENDSGDLLVSSGGHLTAAPMTQSVLDLLARLDAGETITLDQLLRRHAEESSESRVTAIRQQMLGVLSELHTMGAVNID